jgi:hypothetical protein
VETPGEVVYLSRQGDLVAHVPFIHPSTRSRRGYGTSKDSGGPRSRTLAATTVTGRILRRIVVSGSGWRIAKVGRWMPRIYTRGTHQVIATWNRSSWRHPRLPALLVLVQWCKAASRIRPALHRAYILRRSTRGALSFVSGFLPTPEVDSQCDSGDEDCHATDRAAYDGACVVTRLRINL